jgi:putative pyruvate formate lyase activating enzyme
MCRAQRTEESGAGLCAMPARPMVARASLHLWEEPCIRELRRGYGFFSGCPLKCVFCQNEAISQKNFGRTISPERLREIFYSLIDQGAHNIDLVNPTHFSHVLAEV